MMLSVSCSEGLTLGLTAGWNVSQILSRFIGGSRATNEIWR